MAEESKDERERWARVKEVLQSAQALPRERREEHVRQQCAAEPEIAEEVLRLLGQEGDSRDEFLTPPSMLGTATPPTRLGPYRLGEELGRGGMGVVYRAQHEELGREVAVKVLLDSVTRTPRQVERFQREARACARLRHPGIVTIHDVGADGGAHWFSMELVEGRGLHHELAAQRARREGEEHDPLQLPAFESADWIPEVVARLAEVCDAVQAAHDAGIVHRDLKPHNLLLESSGRWRVADFGLAKDEAQGSLTATGEVAGTPSYMSPEQVEAQRGAVDHRTDVYTLGVVLYELLSLRRPFEGRTSREVMSRIVDAPVPPLRRRSPRVPRDLALICETAMARHRGERYASAAELAEDLRRFLRHESPRAQPRPLWRRLRDGVRRRLVPLSLLLAVLAVGGSIGYQAWRDYQRMPRISLSSEPEGAEVWLIEMDLVSNEYLGEARSIGTTPLETRVPKGLYRVVLRKGAARAEGRVHLGGDSMEVDLGVYPLRTDDEATEGMILVEGGDFELGSDQGSIHLPAFWVDRTEVSNREWRAFLQATGRPASGYWPADRQNRPETDLWWRMPATATVGEAKAYARWAGKRLPTVAEWERMAMGPTRQRYPWGEELPLEEERDLGLANLNWTRESRTDLSDPELPRGREARHRYWFDRYVIAVDTPQRGRGPSDPLHTLGNVQEWTETQVPVIREDGSTGLDTGRYWLAGCGWKFLSTLDVCIPQTDSARKADMDGDLEDITIGFRCVRSAAPPSH